MRKILGILIVILVFLASPVRPWGQKRTPLPDNVKSIIGRSCSVSGCHQGKYPAGNMRLEPGKFFSSTLNAPSQEVAGQKIIDTSAPEKSYLLAKIKGEPGIIGARMPAGPAPLPADEIKTIEAWILSLKDGPSGPTGI
jgi:hypothetical protein